VRRLCSTICVRVSAAGGEGRFVDFPLACRTACTRFSASLARARARSERLESVRDGRLIDRPFVGLGCAPGSKIPSCSTTSPDAMARSISVRACGAVMPDRESHVWAHSRVPEPRFPSATARALIEPSEHRLCLACFAWVVVSNSAPIISRPSANFNSSFAHLRFTYATTVIPMPPIRRRRCDARSTVVARYAD
jgi:hypothetical protein